MKAQRVHAMAVMLLLTMCASSCASDATTVLSIDFCNFRVDEIHRRMSGVFSIKYEFRIGEDGVPSDIKVIDNDLAEDSDVRSCIAGWRLGKDLHGAMARAVFTWKHEVGWTDLSIEAPDFKERITISGNRCAYCR